MNEAIALFYPSRACQKVKKAMEINVTKLNKSSEICIIIT